MGPRATLGGDIITAMLDRLPGWLPALLVLAGLLIGLGLRRALRRRVARRADFGAALERDRDPERAGRLRALRAVHEPDAYHDEQVWRDLDMDLVIGVLDRTTSWVGLQVLRDQLSRRDTSDAERAAIERATDFMINDPQRREWYAARLDALGEWSANSLCNLFWGATPPVPWFRPALRVASLAMVASLVAIVWKPAMFVVAIGIATINLAVKAALNSRIEPWLPAMRSLPDFLRVATTFAGARDEALAPALDLLRSRGQELARLRRSVRWAGLRAPDQGALAGTIAEFHVAVREVVNLLFLSDVNAFYTLSSQLSAYAPAARDAFLAIGRIDMAIALASFRASGATVTRPEWGEPRSLMVEGLVHPLVAEPVAASPAIAGRSWLVTGSNMSGKSTFLRALGVGALMAKSLGMVCATRWRGAPFRVLTCIGRSDAVAEGRSYYLAEVERVRLLLDAASGPEPCLFLLDELFRGTNTPERVAASLAVLEHLDRVPHLVVVATHDLELLEWLGSRYESWHFREQVQDDGLTFDYALRPGASSTRNAIALLEVMRYPATVVARARAVVDGRG